MSGASAMAAARRRRAGSQEPNQMQYNNRQPSSNQDNQVKEIDNTNIKMTPLEILKMHDTKISKLEELINKDYYVENEKISNEFDENKIEELLSRKMETLVSSKLNNINDTIKSILINIEKLSNIANINEKNLNKTEEFINELNALKMLVIKNQTLSLETNNDIIKIKDEITDIKNVINDDNNSDNDNMANANALFKSMFSSMNNEEESIFEKINIDDDSDVDISLKNIESLDITSIENLENIKRDIESELLEKKEVIYSNIDSDGKIKIMEDICDSSE
jgi:hypothetical protein